MNLTVYVPDALHKRLEQHRDQINVSAVLQRSLQRELDALEAPTDLSEEALERAVQRLMAEKESFETQFRERGIAEGLKWALTATYEQLAQIERKRRQLKMVAGLDEARILALLKKVCPSTLKGMDLSEEFESASAEREAYVLGVLDGILKVWMRLREASAGSS